MSYKDERVTVNMNIEGWPERLEEQFRLSKKEVRMAPCELDDFDEHKSEIRRLAKKHDYEVRGPFPGRDELQFLKVPPSK